MLTSLVVSLLFVAGVLIVPSLSFGVEEALVRSDERSFEVLRQVIHLRGWLICVGG